MWRGDEQSLAGGWEGWLWREKPIEIAPTNGPVLIDFPETTFRRNREMKDFRPETAKFG